MQLIEGMRLPRPHLCPLEVWNSMEKCWYSDPDERPSFKELKTFLYQLYSSLKDSNKETKTANDGSEASSDHCKTIYAGLMNSQSMLTQYNAICEYNLKYLSVLEEEEMGSAEVKKQKEKSLLYLSPRRLSQSAPESIDKEHISEACQITTNMSSSIVDIRKSVLTIH